MIFARENLDSLLPHLSKLAALHHEELQPFKGLKLNPDFERYRVIEEAGALKVFTLRTEPGLLLGYAVFFVAPHLQYRDSLQAMQDLVYIHPEVRGRGWGREFLEFIDAMLHKDGVDIVMHTCKVHQSFGGLLEKIGYTKIDEIYARRL
jgi:GNAT superfamily N-acetyltransferase